MWANLAFFRPPPCSQHFSSLNAWKLNKTCVWLPIVAVSVAERISIFHPLAAERWISLLSEIRERRNAMATTEKNVSRTAAAAEARSSHGQDSVVFHFLSQHSSESIFSCCCSVIPSLFGRLERICWKFATFSYLHFAVQVCGPQGPQSFRIHLSFYRRQSADWFVTLGDWKRANGNKRTRRQRRAGFNIRIE